MAENIGATKDEDLDVMSALMGDAVADPQEKLKDPEPVHVSALDRAEKAKAEERKNGGIVNDDELADEETGPLRKVMDSDERIAELNATLVDLDSDIEKAKAVVVIKIPETRVEYFEMHDEISRVTFDENGTVIIPPGAKYIVPKTEKLVKIMEERKAKEAAKQAAKEKGEKVADEEGGTNDSAETYMSVDDADETCKGSIVKILIDKTGLGTSITFDDEEKKAISVSSVIQLCEVEDQDLRLIDVVRPENSGTSFMQAIEANKIALSRAPVIFANSGFEGTMSGLNWGEFADVALNPDYEPNMGYNDVINFDKLYKRYSIIYNNLKNLPIGAFKDFEDFLKHFAFDDTQMALYGALVATQPENDSIYLNCQHCNERYLYTYSPRTILDVSSASIEALERMNEISDASPDKKLELFRNSRVSKFKRIKLNRSQYIVDIGSASAYDYLYQILPIIRQITLDAWRMPDHQLTPTDPRRYVPNLIQGARTIYVPNGSGSYYPTRSAEDVYDAVINMPVEDVEVLNAAIDAYRDQYLFTYSLKNTTCTHCGYTEDEIPITPEHLLFQIRLHQLSTNVTVKNFPTF